MAVLKAKPQKIVDFYLPMVEQGLISPLVITRARDNDFINALNDTVTFRVGGLRAVARDYEWRTRTQEIEFDDIEGGAAIAIKLDTHLTSATPLTDEHLTLDDIDFAEEVLTPQVEAVVGRMEAKTVAGLRNIDAKHVLEFGDNVDPGIFALEAKRRMDSQKVAPPNGRSFLVGSNIAAQFLASERLLDYDKNGLAGTPALRDAIIGRLAGSPVIEVPGLDPNEGFYLHKSGLIAGNIAPVVPTGAVTGRRLVKDGWAVRWIQDYDARFARDRSLVSSFYGVNDVRDERVIETGDLVDEDERKNVRVIPFHFTGNAELGNFEASGS